MIWIRPSGVLIAALQYRAVHRSGAWAADNIQANAVPPGGIDTDLSRGPPRVSGRPRALNH